MKTIYKEIAFVVTLFLVCLTLTILIQKPWQVIGNVSPPDVLESTTTPQLVSGTNLCPAGLAASSTVGTLGSVHVLGYGTGELKIYDATTTNINLRSGNLSTSTIHLVDYPKGFGTTTNAFNLRFKRGLLIEYTTGVATTTITYRCGS